MSAMLSALRVIMRAKTAGTSSRPAVRVMNSRALELAAADQGEGRGAGRRGVVEAGLQGDVAVVEAVGVEADDGAAWAGRRRS